MKINVTKNDFLDALQTVQNIVNIRTTLPILSNVLVVAQKEQLFLTTTDLDISVQCQIKAKVSKTGKTTLPVRRLSNIIRELPDSNIDIDVDDKNVAKVKCNSSYFKIIGLSEEEFPPVTKPSEKYSYRLEQSAFKEMLKKTSYAASSDETRHVLNGVFLSFKGGKLIVVATDGRRLALLEYELDFPEESEADIILPTKAVNQLIHSLEDEGELKISVQENNVTFEFSNVVLTTKLIDGTYPNYKQVIPAQCEERVAIERESLLTALKRVSILTTDKSNATKLTFTKNKLDILLNTPDVGEARETIPIKYSGKEISVAFNPDYMMDPLRNLTSDEIFVELTDDLSPGVIKCDTPFLYVLMPMRVS